ncbi:MAG: ABC transporter permease [Desulfohalobiaceae bacterium]|nr:ABC transporter permease [Desulfohalobiaceae bacterium]
MDIQLAWRNIWRNSRRTAVILCAVILGVWSMIFLSALMRGIIEGMIENGISALTGDIQVQDSQYPFDPSVQNSLTHPRKVKGVFAEVLPEDSRYAFRVRVNAVVSNARHTMGVSLVGIDPEQEKEVSFLAGSIWKGNYFQNDDQRAIIIGRALAERFQTGLGRKLILMSRDANGGIASGAYRIRGIFDAEMESTEKRYVFIVKRQAQQMLGLGSRVSEGVVLLENHDMAPQVAKRIEAGLRGESYSVRTWRESLPLLDVYLDLYNGFVLIWFVVIFVAMGFGIINTTLMAVFERMREFGLLKALGMRPKRIVKTVLVESFFVLGLGLAAGDVLGLASCLLLADLGIDLSGFAQGAEFANMSRVIHPSLWLQDVVTANAVVLGLGLAVSLYPAVKAARFKPVEALVHV